MWLIVPVFVIAFFAVELIPFGLPPVAGRDFGEFLGSSDGAALLYGSWAWLAILLAFFIFNTVLGEELLFRGYLLPRMNGIFGSKDWVTNGILFAVYHLHVPWVIPIALLDTFILSLPSRRYQSALIGVITHSSQSLFLSVFPVTTLASSFTRSLPSARTLRRTTLDDPGVCPISPSTSASTPTRSSGHRRTGHGKPRAGRPHGFSNNDCV
ncbi:MULTISPECIES: CPBP family intramembrane glutamic endopeptidase [Microbacterium]|uniref:CPBP family intramembrane glutamic endopeptidase n=1 Tax=Microbacterium TaxID=33882 RepID=UPI0022E6F2DF|nr:CPBP family intramembrane glutamic endopeptidase [Microbacterium liquefaciens]